MSSKNKNKKNKTTNQPNVNKQGNNTSTPKKNDRNAIHKANREKYKKDNTTQENKKEKKQNKESKLPIITIVLGVFSVISIFVDSQSSINIGIYAFVTCIFSALTYFKVPNKKHIAGIGYTCAIIAFIAVILTKYVLK